MAADFLQITAKAARRGAGRPFKQGESRNPAGRRRGSKNRKTVIAELLPQGEADTLARKAADLTLGGNEAALRPAWKDARNGRRARRHKRKRRRYPSSPGNQGSRSPGKTWRVGRRRAGWSKAPTWK
jgi:hypothetical protein